ncbi:MAG: alpha/beta fold hydrolase [Pseudomonadota bacterium]|nr:alpha/beta fold hydrolase [Pseudomonadota bacterium]
MAAIVVAGLLAIHIGFKAPRRVERGNPEEYDLNYEDIWIPGVADKQLFAWWLPVAGSDSSIIILHGWGGNAELMLPLAGPLHQAGLNVLLLDARSHGQSDTAGFSSMPRFAEDADAAIDWLKTYKTESASRLALLGHSVGAGAVLLAASRRNDISAVISIAAFAHPDSMMRSYLDRFRMPEIVKSSVLRYVEWVIGHQFNDIAPMNRLRHVQCPVLLVHGTDDDTVPVTDVHLIHENGTGKKSELLLIEGAGHGSVDKIKQHADELIAFLQRVMPIQA